MSVLVRAVSVVSAVALAVSVYAEVVMVLVASANTKLMQCVVKAV